VQIAGEKRPVLWAYAKKKEFVYVSSSESDTEELFSDDQICLEDIKYYIDQQFKKKMKKAKKRNIFREEKEGMLSGVGQQITQTLLLGGVPILLAYAKKSFLEQRPRMPPPDGIFQQPPSGSIF